MGGATPTASLIRRNNSTAALVATSAVVAVPPASSSHIKEDDCRSLAVNRDILSAIEGVIAAVAACCGEEAKKERYQFDRTYTTGWYICT